MYRDPGARKYSDKAAPDDVPYRSALSKGVTLRFGTGAENGRSRWRYEHICGISNDVRGDVVGYEHDFRGEGDGGGVGGIARSEHSALRRAAHTLALYHFM